MGQLGALLYNSSCLSSVSCGRMARLQRSNSCGISSFQDRRLAMEMGRTGREWIVKFLDWPQLIISHTKPSLPKQEPPNASRLKAFFHLKAHDGVMAVVVILWSVLKLSSKRLTHVCWLVNIQVRTEMARNASSKLLKQILVVWKPRSPIMRSASDLRRVLQSLQAWNRFSTQRTAEPGIFTEEMQEFWIEPPEKLKDVKFFSKFVDQVRELLTLQTFAHFSHARLLQEQKVVKIHLNNLLAQATQPPGTLSVASTIVSQAVNDHVIQQLWYFMGVERDVVCTNCGIRKGWVRTSSDWVI